MLKFVVSDLDGTLLPRGCSGLSGETLESIRTLQKKGITFAVSSGRTLRELQSIFANVPEELCFISCDGALTSFKGKTLSVKPLSGLDIALFSRTDSVYCGIEADYHTGNVPDSSPFFGKTRPLPEGKNDSICKIVTYGEPKIVKSSSNTLRSHWDGSEEGLPVTQYVSLFANKGAALADLQTRLGISPLDTACMGDADNDLPMLRYSKISFCIGHKSPELSRLAKAHADTAEEALRLLLSDEY